MRGVGGSEQRVLFMAAPLTGVDQEMGNASGRIANGQGVAPEAFGQPGQKSSGRLIGQPVLRFRTGDGT